MSPLAPNGSHLRLLHSSESEPGPASALASALASAYASVYVSAFASTSASATRRVSQCLCQCSAKADRQQLQCKASAIRIQAAN